MPSSTDEQLKTYFDALTAQLGRVADASPPTAAHRRRPNRIAWAAAAAVLVVGAIVTVAAVGHERTGGRGPTATPLDDTTTSVTRAPGGTWAPLAVSDLAGFEGSATAITTADGDVLAVYAENNGSPDGPRVLRIDPKTGDTQTYGPGPLPWRASPAVLLHGHTLFILGGSGADPQSTPTAAALDITTGEWSEVPNAPVRSELISDDNGIPVVGDVAYFWNANVSFDLATRTWQPIAAAPLSPRTRTAAAAAGHKVVVWGGCASDASEGCMPADRRLSDGAVLDTDTGTWSAMAAGPLVAAPAAVAAPAGDSVLIVASGSGGTAHTVALFDPATNGWTETSAPPAPIPVLPAYTATDGIATFAGGSPAGMYFSLNTETGAWSPLPDGGPQRTAAAMTWVGPSMVVVGGLPEGSPWVFTTSGG